MAEDEKSLQDAVQLFNEGSFGDAATVLEQLLTRDGDDVTARGWLAPRPLSQRQLLGGGSSLSDPCRSAQSEGKRYLQPR